VGFKEATVAPWFVTDFHAGQARAEHPGFPARSDNLPGEDKVWSAFFTNVLRGSADGPWYDQTFSTQVDYSRTFSDGGTGLKEAPPTITATSIAGVNPALEGGGAPDGGFVPTVASPGETAGAINVDYSSIPALGGQLVTKLQTLGAGLGTNGLLLAPKEASDLQSTLDAANSSDTCMSPQYPAGMTAWSGDKAS
tara:strand:- start:28 stop:612 length:585 start_codon:yes stop_codon:yes gene_type:complete